MSLIGDGFLFWGIEPNLSENYICDVMARQNCSPTTFLREGRVDTKLPAEEVLPATLRDRER